MMILDIKGHLVMHGYMEVKDNLSIPKEKFSSL